MMRDVLIIAELTFREAYRRMILTLALVLSVVFVAIYGVGFYHIYQDLMRYTGTQALLTSSGFNFTVMAAFYVVSFLGVVVAVLLSVDTVSGEISSHTIQSLAARPIARSSLILGKWLGLSALLSAFVVLLAGGVTLVTQVISGYTPPRVLEGIGLIVLQALTMLSLAVLGSTRLSTVANGVCVFLLYGLAFVGGWIEQIGSFTGSQTTTDLGILSSLLVPSEAMWKLAAYIMQPPIVHSMGVSPFGIANPPSAVMLAYTLAYIVAMVWLSVRSFAARDL